MKRNHLRKRFFIWKSAQPRLLAGIEFIFIALLLASGTIFSIVANRDLTESYLKAHLTIRNMLEILVPSLALINLIGLVASVFLAVLFTHRIAGPVYRLCKILDQIGQGDLTPIVKFRKHDELTELDDATTAMILSLRNRITDLKTVSAQLSLDLTRDDLNQARLTAQTLEKSLSAFQLPPKLMPNARNYHDD